MSSDGLRLSVEKMRAAGVHETAIDTFAHYYERLVAGETGLLPESEIEPLRDVADFDALEGQAGSQLIDEAVVIKVNGGLGTSMGMTRAKSLLEVKDGLSFLDVTARQVLGVRRRTGARLPLVLMNSFATQADSRRALARHEGLAADVPADFLQNKEPKIRADDLTPVEWPANPDLEWAPPGHGDLYTALVTSGLLPRLLEHGYRYAFVSNSDNLGATFDPRILQWFASRGLPYASEVCDRTEADKKGGHLARLRDGGGLVLRETAQTPDEDVAAFQDVERHPYFNCNNLWMDLQALSAVLEARDGVLGLPMIVNRKTVDPGDKTTPAVIQLESAMGAAIAVFDGAEALRVPRSRFAPVKTTSDLLVLRSDAYELTPESEVRLAPAREGRVPIAALDDDYFKLVRDFDARVPAGAPSLVACDRLTVRGDVTFGAGVVCRGTVEVDGPLQVEDGAVLEGAAQGAA
ncbi:MAG TPA: UTP--glucose-1-phosphate uridylyltransferase [Solirubrobacteraceae bacterium]|jgi:UTP--glucose-1-phosphate uridylyltransferase